ncbi:hypothetical protein RhiirA1_474341 [Rhizophagus irregularis]|uniref:Uncharacterized protein n=1 Tax=Rhizophagus irregularis TaxID=588596 RepID=A0A2N0QYS8_9GLOM|nr:hypothetical protein RhiirA1_474341 [Rhizophagus irregularis]
MLEHLFMLQKQRSEETGLRLPEISRKNLQRKTQKAVKIYMIFESRDPGQNSVEVSELIAPIPVTHGSNSLGNSLFTLQITPSEAENNVDYDDVYFNDSMPSSIEKEMNKVKINDDKEMPDDSDDDGYNSYGGYNEYGEYDRGYYYHNRRYERKSSPMMSPIISPVTA